MMGAVHPKASVGVDGAQDRSWFALIAEELQGFLGRRAPTTHDAARILGQAAARKRKIDNRTLEERKAAFHARLSAERDGGWPVPPATINKELAR